MEENYSDIFTSNDQRAPAPAPDSPLYGTPWHTDDEIYDHVIWLRYEEKWDWKYIKENLEKEGLPSDYAAAIVENTKAIGREVNTKNRLRGIVEIIVGIVLIIIGIWIMTDGLDTRRSARALIASFIGGPWVIIDGIRRLSR